jgi:hypothetical protein
MKPFSGLKLRSLLIAGVILMCSACGKDPGGITANMTAYNHSVESIASFDVELSTGAAVGAGFIAPGQGGGALTCCVTLPPAWTPGLKVTVRKIAGHNGETQVTIKSVAIPKYDATQNNNLNVHFLNDGNVKVFVTQYALGHQNYPLRGKEADLVPGVPLQIRWK